MLGTEEREIGVIEVTRAEPRFSCAKAVSGNIGQGVTLKRLVSEEPEQPNQRNGPERVGRSPACPSIAYTLPLAGAGFTVPPPCAGRGDPTAPSRVVSSPGR